MNGSAPFRHRSRVIAMRPLLRLGAALLGLTLVGACQTATTRRTTPRFETAFSSTGVVDNRPLVSLPNSGSVTSVQETRSSASLRQRILFSQSQERVDVTIASTRIWDDPAMTKPSRAGIAAELATLDGSYRVLRQPVQNAYGPLGVAVSERCAYAWQWIDALQRVELGRDALRGPVAVSLRVHHCRPRSVGADTLLSDLTRMRLGVSTAPVGIARSRVVRARPVAASIETVQQPVVVTTAPPSPPSVAVNSSRTLVSLPTVSAAQPYLVPTAPTAMEAAIPLVPRPAVATDRVRFLTDAMPAPSRSAASSSQRSQTVSDEPSVRPANGAKSPPPGW